VIQCAQLAKLNHIFSGEFETPPHSTSAISFVSGKDLQVQHALAPNVISGCGTHQFGNTVKEDAHCAPKYFFSRQNRRRQKENLFQ
jgi:hypothetical protein